MENSNSNYRYISGGILIVLGVLFLGRELDWFHIDWQRLFKLWPLLLIGAGLSRLAGKSWGAGAALLVIFGIGLLMYSFSPKSQNRNFYWDNDDDETTLNMESDTKNDDDDDDDDNNEETKDEKDESSIVETEISRLFSENMEPSFTTAKLKLNGGITGFNIMASQSDKLFEANTKSNIMDFNLEKKIKNGTVELEFKAKNRNGKDIDIDLGDDKQNSKNNANIELNKNIAWDLEFDLGAAGANLDLSELNVKSADLKTGMSGITLKMGDKQKNSYIKIDSGIAGIEIKTPKNVSVKITNSSTFSVNDLDGFVKKGGSYYSENYNSANKTITIDYDGALSAFKVVQY